MEIHGSLWSKVTFPNLLPAQRHASPSRKRVLPEIDHNYTVGVIYVYICIDCPSILFHMVPESINNLICWNCRGCLGKSIGPVQYRFAIPSLRAQCLVTRSAPCGNLWLAQFFWQKKTEKKTSKKMGQLHTLEPARRPASTRLIHIMYSLSTHTFACQLKVT